MTLWPAAVQDRFRRETRDILEVIFPPVCGICQKPADSPDRLICQRCWDSIQEMEIPSCLNCRQPLEKEDFCSVCGDDAATVFSVGFFTGHLQTILHELKFKGLKPLGQPLGRKIAAAISKRKLAEELDMVLPVPLHPYRRYSRGFNQAEEIAREISLRLGLSLRTDLLYQTRRTRQQARLPASLREKNVRGAYAVDDDAGELKGKRILLVDDVTTTGATLRENIRILKAASAKTIIVAVAATAV